MILVPLNGEPGEFRPEESTESVLESHSAGVEGERSGTFSQESDAFDVSLSGTLSMLSKEQRIPHGYQVSKGCGKLLLLSNRPSYLK